jgi:hypothetical protein
MGSVGFNLRVLLIQFHERLSTTAKSPSHTASYVEGDELRRLRLYDGDRTSWLSVRSYWMPSFDSDRSRFRKWFL